MNVKTAPHPEYVVSSSLLVRRTVLGTIGITAVGVAIGLSVSSEAAVGVAIGGAAALAAFGMIVRRVRGLSEIPRAEVSFVVYRWTFARLLLYTLALFLAYLVDPDHHHALLGAASGLISGRVVLIAAGIIAWRQSRPGPHRTGPT